MAEERDAGGHRAWRPSLWLRTLAATSHAPWPIGRSIRAAVGVAGPLLVATLAGDALVGMWISMGSLLLAAGERPVSYGAHFRQILITAPIAAGAYLLGVLSAAPPIVTIVVMTMLALTSGVLSGYSSPLSIGTMQALLIAAVAIGVDAAAPYWPAALLFLAGAAVFAALLAIEAVFDHRRPERTALATLLRALATLASTRTDGNGEVAAARASALAALDSYDGLALARRGNVEGPTREYARASRISRAADQLLARLLAHDADPTLCRETAARLEECTAALLRRARPPRRTGDPPTLVRLAMLESAIWGPMSATQELPMVGRARRSPPGPDLWAAAGRLALCTALAYAAFFLLPLPHPYWIALTVALVMKPDLGSVFGRAVLRSVGTVGGAVIAIGLGLLTDPVVLAVAIAGLAACLPWAMARSYAWQALVLTPLIMVLIDLVEPRGSIVELSTARVVTTLAGSVIVIVAGYLIWPSARHTRVAEPFEAALTALAGYARDVAANAPADAVARDRRAVYRRLSDTRVGLQRRLAEPPPAGREAWAWLPIVTAAERVADRITDASASRTPAPDGPDAGVLSALAGDLAAFTSTGAQTDATQRRPAPPAHGEAAVDPSLRELADEMASLRPMLARARPSRGGGAERADTVRVVS